MKRNTHQKITVLGTLQAMRGEHPTAEAVYAQVAKQIPSVSVATVYRILNQYAKEGIIAQLHIPESPNRFDDLTEPHCHLLCSRCARVMDIALEGYPPQELPQSAHSGFRITAVEFTFRGICPDCNQ